MNKQKKEMESEGFNQKTQVTNNDRAARLAASLKSNIARRKAQAKARSVDARETKNT
ncbi:MAG: hypothetical protein ACO20X_08835 [Alphaproteobacteria bacterium]|jgi:hypothetical protein